MIKKFYSNKSRIGWKYDQQKRKHFSWGFDIRLADGRRKREPGFLNKADAESAVSRVRLWEKEMRYKGASVYVAGFSAVCRLLAAPVPQAHIAQNSPTRSGWPIALGAVSRAVYKGDSLRVLPSHTL
jgi:hypothetical protein